MQKWLKESSYAKYSSAFKVHRIDGEVLTGLDNVSLKDAGEVGSVYTRREADGGRWYICLQAHTFRTSILHFTRRSIGYSRQYFSIDAELL